MEIGKQIKYFREKKGITQEELASEIGVSGKQGISRFENGVRNPKRETLEKIAKVLGCELVYELREK